MPDVCACFTERLGCSSGKLALRLASELHMPLQLTSSIWRGAPLLRLYDMLQLQRSTRELGQRLLASRCGLPWCALRFLASL